MVKPEGKTVQLRVVIAASVYTDADTDEGLIGDDLHTALVNAFLNGDVDTDPDLGTLDVNCIVYEIVRDEGIL